MKIIFLDFDGPLTNFRTMFQSGFNQAFDPVAIQCLNHICAASGAKIVCTSVRTWDGDRQNFLKTRTVMEEAGLDVRHLHPDWSCRIDSGRRELHILDWLGTHPGFTHYAIIDDDIVDLPNFIRVDCYDGILKDQFEMVARYLGFDLMEAFRVAQNAAYDYDQLRLEFGIYDMDYNDSVMERPRRDPIPL